MRLDNNPTSNSDRECIAVPPLCRVVADLRASRMFLSTKGQASRSSKPSKGKVTSREFLGNSANRTRLRS